MMDLSNMAIDDLKDDLITKEEHWKDLKLSLQSDFEFVRAQPMDALKSFFKYNRTLFYDYFNDCITGKELADFAKFDCGGIMDKSLSTQVIMT